MAYLTDSVSVYFFPLFYELNNLSFLFDDLIVFLPLLALLMTDLFLEAENILLDANELYFAVSFACLFEYSI